MDYFCALKNLIILVALLAGACNGADPNLSEDLVSDVFQNYSANMIPLCQADQPVQLHLGIALRQIIDLNEKEQLLTSYVWVRMRWNDCRISWNASDYNNISMITVPYKMVWVPDIALYDSAVEGEMLAGSDNYRAQISSDGTMNYFFPAILISTCRVNVRHFPYDTQYCSLKFGSWSYNGFSLDLVSGNADMSTYNENSEWYIEDLPVKRHLLYYNCCPEPYPDVTYYIIMKRRPEFYVTTWIFPCVLVAVVAALTFVLPVESGEKVGLNVTVLLSLAVFMLVVTDMMPPASDSFPLMGSYFAACMALVSISCVQTVIIITIHNQGASGRRVPRWVRVYILEWARVFKLCRNDNKVNKVTNDDLEDLVEKKPRENGQLHIESIENSKNNNNARETQSRMEMLSRAEIRADLKSAKLSHATRVGIDDHTKYLMKILKILENKTKEEEISGEWQELAKTLDRIFLVLYLIASIFVFLYYFLNTVQ